MAHQDGSGAACTFGLLPGEHVVFGTSFFASVVNWLSFGSRSTRGVTVTPRFKFPAGGGRCYQAQGGNCAISQSVAIQASVNSSVGVTFAAINAQLGGTYSETLTTQVSCSNDLPPRLYLRAYPSGDFVFFEVNGSKGTAFLPTGIQCLQEE